MLMSIIKERMFSLYKKAIPEEKVKSQKKGCGQFLGLF